MQKISNSKTLATDILSKELFISAMTLELSSYKHIND